MVIMDEQNETLFNFIIHIYHTLTPQAFSKEPANFCFVYEQLTESTAMLAGLQGCI